MHAGEGDGEWEVCSWRLDMERSEQLGSACRGGGGGVGGVTVPN